MNTTLLGGAIRMAVTLLEVKMHTFGKRGELLKPKKETSVEPDSCTTPPQQRTKHTQLRGMHGVCLRSHKATISGRDLFVKGSDGASPSANPHLYQSLGVMAMERGRIQEAREHFKEYKDGSRGSISRSLASMGILESRGKQRPSKTLPVWFGRPK